MPKTRELKKEAPGTQKWRHSQWFVTINTNRATYDHERLHRVLVGIFEDDETFYELFDGDTTTVDKANATVEFAIEAGPRNGKIHAHVLIRLRHRTVMKLRIAVLRDVLEQALNIEGIHIDVKASSPTTATMQEYLRKAIEN